MKAAAILVSWNALDLLTRSLDALAAQTRPFDRVIVVDNGSAGIESLPPWQGPGAFRLEALGKNVGFAAANNHGFELCADCEFVALVNPDAFLAPDWLERMLDAAGRYPHAASFASLLLQDRNPSHFDGIGDAYHVCGLGWRLGHGSPVVDITEREVFSPCAAAAFYRRQAVVEVDAFDEDFFCYVEDVDLGFRLRLAGASCILVPTAVARHVGGATSGGQRSPFEVYHGHRNLVWCFVKNMPGWLFWACLPLHLLANLTAMGVYAWRGQFRNVLRAKLDAMRAIRVVWKKRVKIQKRRKAGWRDVLIILSKVFWK